jgi:hypothetical protein
MVQLALILAALLLLGLWNIGFGLYGLRRATTRCQNALAGLVTLMGLPFLFAFTWIILSMFKLI